MQKFTSSGQFVTTWGSAGNGIGQFMHIHSITVDASANVYVVDSILDRIQKFTSSGVFITSWGSSGTGNGQFQNPTGIAVDDGGLVYVSDGSLNRIQKFTANGVFVSSWGNGGTGNGQFNFPRGLTLDSTGVLYVSDRFNHRMQSFVTDGTFLTQWGGFGSGNGQFDGPYTIGAAPDDRIYVADTNNNRIQVFECLAGSGEDLLLTTLVNGGGLPTGCTKIATGGDLLTATVTSPGTTFVGHQVFIVAQGYATGGTPPVSPVGFPEIHVDPLAILVVLCTPMLSSGGTSLFVTLPPGLAGLTFRLQGITVSPSAANGVFAVASAHDLVVQ